MSYEEQYRRWKKYQYSPRLGDHLIPEAAAQGGMQATDAQRWAVADGLVPGYVAPRQAGPSRPPIKVNPVRGGGGFLGPGGARPQVQGQNPFAAKAAQMGMKDFQGAQAQALRGGNGQKIS